MRSVDAGMLKIWPDEHLWPNAVNWLQFCGDSPRRCLRCDIRENHAFSAKPCGWTPLPWLRQCESCEEIVTQRQATIVGYMFTCHLCGHVNHLIRVPQ